MDWVVRYVIVKVIGQREVKKKKNELSEVAEYPILSKNKKYATRWDNWKHGDLRYVEWKQFENSKDLQYSFFF